MFRQTYPSFRAVCYLSLSFFNVVPLFILLDLKSVSMICYMIAIPLIFLFVVIMLNIKLSEFNEKRLRYLTMGGLLGVLFIIEIAFIYNFEGWINCPLVEMPFISLIGIVIIIYICYLYFKARNRLKNFLGQPLFQITCVSLFGPHTLMTKGAHLYEQLPPFFIILVLALTVAVGLYVGLKKKANPQFNTTNMIPNVIFWIFSMVRSGATA